MEKSVFTNEYAIFLELLTEKRKNANITQVQMAEGLDTTQSVVSKLERGERRLDVVQLLAFCQLLGITMTQFIEEFERRLSGKKAKRKRN